MQTEEKNPNEKVREGAGLPENRLAAENVRSGFVEGPKGTSVSEDITIGDAKCGIGQDVEEKELVELIATIIVNHTLRIAYENGYPLHKVQ